MMRFATPAIAAAVLLLTQAAPGLAQTTANPEAAPPAATAPAPAPAEAAPSAPATAPAPKPHRTARRKRMTMHQRFAKANTAQDGHLTADQAKAANWTYVERNFDAIDRDHKGYVTEADIHAYAHAQYLARRAARAKTAPATETAPPAAPAVPPPAAAPAPQQ